MKKIPGRNGKNNLFQTRRRRRRPRIPIFLPRRVVNDQTSLYPLPSVSFTVLYRYAKLVADGEIIRLIFFSPANFRSGYLFIYLIYFFLQSRNTTRPAHCFCSRYFNYFYTRRRSCTTIVLLLLRLSRISYFMKTALRRAQYEITVTFISYIFGFPRTHSNRCDFYFYSQLLRSLTSRAIVSSAREEKKCSKGLW